MSKFDNLVRTVSDVFGDKKKKTSSYDTLATVKRVEGNMAWVSIPGGVDETPVRLTVNAVAGEEVLVRVGNGRAYIIGNSTSPPTNDRVANKAVLMSSVAKSTAHAVTLDLDNFKNSVVTDSRIANSIMRNSTVISSTITNSIVDNCELVESHIYNSTLEDFTYVDGWISDFSVYFAHIVDGVIDNAKIGYADINGLHTHYAAIDMANVDNAWIENGVIKNGAIKNQHVESVSASKLTAGTIDASNITVTNLNASNITTGSITVDGITIDVANNEASIDGGYIQNGTITLNGLAQEVKDEIDGAIETWTGTSIPTLNNAPASSWTTNALKKKHVGDVYYVVNPQQEADGYCYRFTMSGTEQNPTFEWHLIKDSAITAALQDIIDLQGDVGEIKDFDSQLSSWKTTTDSNLTSYMNRTSTLETAIGTKVDASTFNVVSQQVDTNSASITTLVTRVDGYDAEFINVITEDGLEVVDETDEEVVILDQSVVTMITNTTNDIIQKADSNEIRIASLTTVVSENRDEMEYKYSDLYQDLNGFKLEVGSTYTTLSDFSDYQETVSSTYVSNSSLQLYDEGIRAHVSSTYATKTAADENTQYIYISKSSDAVPSAPSSWVADTEVNSLKDESDVVVTDESGTNIEDEDLQNTWLTKMPSYNPAYPYVFIAKQHKKVSGNLECSTPKLYSESYDIRREMEYMSESLVSESTFELRSGSIEAKVSGKVDGEHVISSINMSPEEIKIAANRVNIEGAAIFSTGRLSASNLDNAYIQTIYKSVDSNGDHTAPTVWVTDTTGSQNTWTTVRPVYNSSYPTLYTAKQKKSHDDSGTITCSTPVIDQTTTVIDGGHITTGTIDTARLNVSNIIQVGGIATETYAQDEVGKYVTNISGGGIRVRESTNPNSYIDITSSGLGLYARNIHIGDFSLLSQATATYTEYLHTTVDSRGVVDDSFYEYLKTLKYRPHTISSVVLYAAVVRSASSLRNIYSQTITLTQSEQYITWRGVENVAKVKYRWDNSDTKRKFYLCVKRLDDEAVIKFRMAITYTTESNNLSRIQLGSYSLGEANNLLEVGNGTNSLGSHSNAFSVDLSGRVTAYGNYTTSSDMKTNEDVPANVYERGYYITDREGYEWATFRATKRVDGRQGLQLEAQRTINGTRYAPGLNIFIGDDGYSTAEVMGAEILLDNARALRGRKTDGTSVHIAQVSSSDNIELGYGTYYDEIGATNLYGNNINLYTKNKIYTNSKYAIITRSLSIYDQSISGNSLKWTSINVSYTDYVAVGIVGFWAENSASDGTGESSIHPYRVYLSSSTTATIAVRNHSSSTAKVNLRIEVLYVHSSLK